MDGRGRALSEVREGELVGMVLCAGLGTRLRPLTERVPKAAVPVCGLPLVRYALARLAAGGVRRAVVNTHHLAPAMEAAARSAAAAAGLPLAVSHEPVIAGTGGALRQARGLLAGAGLLVLWNGDVLCDLDLEPVLAEHRRTGALATMVLARMPPGGGYAAVEVDGPGVVRRIAGRGPGGKDLRALHFTGVHVLSPALLDEVPAEPFACDINRDVYPRLLERGLVRGHLAAGYWNDLGTPARYLEANLDLLGGRLPKERLRGSDPFAGPGAFARPGIWLAAGAAVEPGAALRAPVLLAEGARVEAGAAVGPAVVLGAGCRVAAGATLRESVVWDATEVEPGETLEGVVAAGRARLSVRAAAGGGPGG